MKELGALRDEQSAVVKELKDLAASYRLEEEQGPRLSLKR